MQAIILEKAGGVENLIMKDIDKPLAEENEVLVEVKAIGVNPVDYKVRANEEALTWICGEERPVIIGWDIAGVVVAVGDTVTTFEVGDAVFGMVNFPGAGNAYAEVVAAPESHLAKIPSTISFEAAAATTLAALTALQVIETRVKKDDRVLIHAGSGGVGHFAIQIAKALGAYVIATSSAKNKDFVMSMGADEHIDYRSQAFEEVTTNIDFVLDPMGGEVLLKSIQVVKEGGSIICLLAKHVTEEVLEQVGKRNINVSPLLVQSNGKDMNTLANMLKSGAVKPHVSKAFPFENMGDAHLQLESGRTVGKVVVTV